MTNRHCDINRLQIKFLDFDMWKHKMLYIYLIHKECWF